MVTALLLLFNRHLAEVANRGRRDLLEDLLAGSRADRAEIEARAVDLDVDLAADLVLVVCSTPRDRADAEQAASFYAGCHRGLSARVEGQLVLLVPGADPGGAAREAAADLGRTLGGPVTAAGERVRSAGSVPDPAAIGQAYRQSRACLRAMLALQRAGDGGTTAELGFVGVLLSSGDTGREFVRRTIGPLLDYDAARGSELAATLDAWFGQGGHLVRTAGQLHIHPNTVGQRLTRVGKLLGTDWSGPGRSLEIQLALQLRTVLGDSTAAG